MRTISTLTIVALLAIPVVGSSQTGPIGQTMTEEQFETLTEEEKKKVSFRSIVIGEGRENLIELIEIGLFMQLRQLMYVGKDLSEMVRKFQRDLGAEADGDIKIGEMDELERRVTLVRSTSVIALGFMTLSIADSYAQAEGTWVMDGEKIGQPINKVLIECSRATGECTAIKAYVDVSGNSYYLGLESDTYSIIKWTTTEILAESGSESDCRRETLRLNQPADEVTSITTNNTAAACELLGDELPKLEVPRVVRLVDGFEPTNGYFSERRKNASEYTASEFRSKLKSARENSD